MNDRMIREMFQGVHRAAELEIETLRRTATRLEGLVRQAEELHRVNLALRGLVTDLRRRGNATRS